MASKLQQRLAAKTAGIERKSDEIDKPKVIEAAKPAVPEQPRPKASETDQARPDESGDATGGENQVPDAGQVIIGVKRSASMPGQLGAFRLEAQKYQTIISELQAKLAAAKDAGGETKRIRVDLIDDSPYQPRMELDPEEIDELAKTMAAARQADPIKVRMVNGRYELISGHRRTKAARTLGWAEIDAIIEVRTDEEAEIEAMLLVVGNVGLSDYELAKMYARALQRGICSNQSMLSAFFGAKQPHVSARLAMLDLPDEIVSMLEARPRLFGYECGKTIRSLIALYPKDLDVIVKGVRRLSDGMKQNTLKGWVQQAIKSQGVTQDGDDKKTITKDGRPVFTTKRDPRSVTVSCKIPGMDVNELEERLRAWLEELANDAAFVPPVKSKKGSKESNVVENQ